MKKILFLILCTLTIFPAWAQQDALFTQYIFNKMVINPGYAGSVGALDITSVNRLQWTGIDGAPQTYSLSAHSPIKIKGVGVGGYLYTDILGPETKFGAIGSFSYTINLSANAKLAFGLEAGILYYKFDTNKLILESGDDPYFVDNSFYNEVVPDMNIGVYAYSDFWYIGISTKHLLNNEFAYSDIQNGSPTFSKLKQHIYIMGGYVLPLVDDRIYFRPSAFLKYVVNAPVSVDFNASVFFSKGFWVGIGYRTDKALMFLTEVNITPQLRFGYSYDLELGAISGFDDGSHEFMLGYLFNQNRKKFKNPRFF